MKNIGLNILLVLSCTRYQTNAYVIHFSIIFMCSARSDVQLETFVLNTCTWQYDYFIDIGIIKML